MTYDEEQAYNTPRAINDDKIETYSKEDKKDDDTSKEIQETLVKQRVAKTAQDIFMGVR
jgi:cell division protein FtsL